MDSIKGKSILIGLCLFIGLMAPTYQAFIKHSWQKGQAEQNLLKIYSDTIYLTMTQRYNYARILQTVLAANGYDFSAMKPIAEEILKNKDCLYVSVIEDGAVTAFFSRDLTQSMVGRPLAALDYSHSLAQSVGGLVVEGPVEDSITAASVFLIIQPVYQGGVYRGQIAVAVDAAAAIQSFGLEQLLSDRFDYELWRIDPNNGAKRVIARSNEEMFFANAQEIQMEFPCVWKLTIVQRDRWFSMSLFAGASFLVMLVSVFATLWLYGVFKRKKLAHSLEEQDFYDAETNFFSREGFLAEMQRMLDSDKDKVYHLFFLQIQNYAQLAPLLSKAEKTEYFTFIIERIDDFVQAPYVIGRISEASFGLLVCDSIEPNELYHVEKGLALELLRKFSCRDKKVILSVSCGSSSFTCDGTSAEEILLAAIKDCEVRFSPGDMSKS